VDHKDKRTDQVRTARDSRPGNSVLEKQEVSVTRGTAAEEDGSPVIDSYPMTGVAAAPSRIPEGEPEEASWEANIGSLHITITIPHDMLEQVGRSSGEAKMKMAGTLAAQTLQRYPQLGFSSSVDPVTLWSDIRKSILNAFDRHSMPSN
jgi:hypothetical protein